MKRVFLFAAALSALVLTGCKKEKIDPTKPSVTWEANPGFAVQELTPALDGKVTVGAPGKIGELSLVLGLGDFNILVNPYISIASNKGTVSPKNPVNPVLDLINDDASASFVRGLGMQAGPALKEKEQVVLDLKAVLEAITKGQVVGDNTTFYAEVRVKDRDGNAVSRTAKFHYTEAPRFTWAKNPTFGEVDLDAEKIDCKVVVLASGKFDQLTVKLENGSDASLVKYVKNRTTGQQMVIDLIGDAAVANNFPAGAFPAVSAVEGKTQCTLDFAFLYDLRPDMSASTNIFTVTAVDKNGKKTVQQIKFVKNAK